MTPCLWGWIGNRIWEMNVQNELGRRLLTTRPPVLRGSTVPQYQKREEKDWILVRLEITLAAGFLFISGAPIGFRTRALVCSLTTPGLPGLFAPVSLVSWWDRCTAGLPREPHRVCYDRRLMQNKLSAQPPALLSFLLHLFLQGHKLFWVESGE